jgi:hypothetical protein
VTTLPSLDQTSHLLRRLASLYNRLGREIGTRPLVLPDGKFFPDAFTADEKSVRRLARRMKSHAGMDDIPIKVRVVGTDDAAAADGGCCGGSCHSGAPAKESSTKTESKAAHACSGKCADGGSGKCADGGCGKCADGGCGDCSSHEENDGPTPRLVDLGDEWLIQVPAAEVRANIVLTTNLAKVLGLIFLLENLPKGTSIEQPVEASVEIASVALGFGALLLEGSYLYSKSCGGPKVGRVTTLDCGSISLLTALFIARGKHRSQPLKRHLSTTQSAAFGEAEHLVSANRTLVEKLATSPEQLLSGEISIRTSLGLWDRVFGGRRGAKADLRQVSDFDLDELEAMVSAQPAIEAQRRSHGADAKHAELRALVDDALAESVNEAEA